MPTIPDPRSNALSLAARSLVHLNDVPEHARPWWLWRIEPPGPTTFNVLAATGAPPIHPDFPDMFLVELRMKVDEAYGCDMPDVAIYATEEEIRMGGGEGRRDL